MPPELRAGLGLVLVFTGAYLIGSAIIDPPAPPAPGEWADMTPDLDGPTPGPADDGATVDAEA